MDDRDVATLTMIEQHRKHKAEVMAIAVSDTLDANFVVAGDRQGRISAWERDAYVRERIMIAPLSWWCLNCRANRVPHDDW